ncbi:hypothetical protein HRbin39_01646 [bacterium HR39]|nr:hypothetical protein HRbin39_01646 [bacterium HR39]
MATESRPRVRVPKTAARGEIVEVKALISHEMESGQRKDSQGNIIPRKIINRFEARYNGELVFAMDLHPAISANPYIAFKLKVDEPGELEFKWVDDDGSVYTDKAKIDVKG